MARKGWDALSDSYRRRLTVSGITKERYESGTPLHDARGHGTKGREAFAKRTARFARMYDPVGTERHVAHTRDFLRHMGPGQADPYMSYQRKMVRLYESGDTAAAERMWEDRDKSIPDELWWYHGVFGG